MFLVRLVKNILKLLAFIFMLIFFLWSIGGVYYLNIIPQAYKSYAALGYAVIILLIIILLKRRWYAYSLTFLIFLSLASYYKFETPTNNQEDWNINYKLMPSAVVNGNEVTIKNVRDFDYKSENDFTVRYYDKTYNLNNLDSLYITFCYWDGNKAFAHIILSFGFKNSDYLALSVETRLKNGQTQGGLSGLYNQYGLIYIFSDEKDVLKLRTNYRKEDLYMYQVNMDKETLRSFFLTIINKVNYLDKHPQFYNTIKDNCFTSILKDLRDTQKKRLPFDYRFILNGYADQMLFDEGVLVDETETSFSDFKKKHNINQYVKPNFSLFDNYSKAIRDFNGK